MAVREFSARLVEDRALPPLRSGVSIPQMPVAAGTHGPDETEGFVRESELLILRALRSLGETFGETFWPGRPLEEREPRYGDDMVSDRPIEAHELLESPELQGLLGEILLFRGERETDLELLKDAEAAFRAALESTGRLAPLERATTELNLGRVLLVLSEREGGASRMSQAVQAFRAACEALTAKIASLTAPPRRAEGADPPV